MQTNKSNYNVNIQHPNVWESNSTLFHERLQQMDSRKRTCKESI